MLQSVGIIKRKSSTGAGSWVRKAILALVLVAMLFLIGVPPGHTSERAFDEYQVKAVFLYRLTLFVTWPENAFLRADQPFVIGILGDDPFGHHIDQVIKNEKFKGRSVIVRRFASLEAVLKSPSQVLYINPALKHRWHQMKQKLAAHAILTVSDMEAFCQHGGMINIKTRVNKIKIEVNPEETRIPGIKISSKLLKISRNVSTASNGGQR